MAGHPTNPPTEAEVAAWAHEVWARHTRDEDEGVAAWAAWATPTRIVRAAAAVWYGQGQFALAAALYEVNVLHLG